MKKILFFLFLFINTIGFSQERVQGLEKIIVERYYISNKADSVKADADAEEAGPDYQKGTLPCGSVTYRIYADLLPNFKLISVYSDKIRNQKISFRSSTSFYNHPKGHLFAMNTKKDILNSTLVLDSYITLGGAAKGFYGILKKEDDSSPSWFSAANVDGVLLNNMPGVIGIPLMQKDGFVAGSGIQTPFTIGFEGDVFDDGTKPGDSLVVRGGAYYTTGIVRGADTLENKVLIAQVTTKGRFQFELNVLIQSLTNGRGQFYVAQNPQPAIFPSTADDDVKLTSLTYDSDAIANNPAASDNSASINVSVYPNPANSSLVLEINPVEQSSKGSYTIYGLIGNVITHKEFLGIAKNYTEEIDISSLEKGLYIIQVIINGATTAKKIVKN